MGVDYTAVLMVGREFDSPEEAADFLRSHGLSIPDEDSKEMEYGLQEYLYANDVENLEFDHLNYYSSWDGGVLGWSPSIYPPENFPVQVQQMQEKWVALFGETADIIHTVRVH